MHIISIAVIWLVALSSWNAVASTEKVHDKTVLVTGASSGIGRTIAENLAQGGFFVYAGARKKQDMDERNALENIQAVRLDVTVQEDIDNVVRLIRR